MNGWMKLQDGSWGLRVAGAVAPVDVVTATRKDGSTSEETIASVLSKSADGASVCSIVAKPRAALADTSAHQASRVKRGFPARRSSWRPCGYPGCNPNHCDDCDGAGARGARGY